MSTALEFDAIRGLNPEIEQIEAVCYGLDHDLLTNDQLHALTDSDGLAELLAGTGTDAAWRGVHRGRPHRPARPGAANRLGTGGKTPKTPPPAATFACNYPVVSTSTGSGRCGFSTS